MSQLLITRQGRTIVSAYHHPQKGIQQFHIVPEDEKEIRIGDIYLGMVQNIVANIKAAFVEIAPGVNGYLPLEESRHAIYANPKNTDKLCIGDKILVQVSREPIKSKPVSLTTDFTLSGKFAVLMPYHPEIKLSSKITEKEERDRLLKIGREVLGEYGYGCILRTNAAGHTEEEIRIALIRLAEQYGSIRDKGIHSVRHARLYTGIPAYLADMRDAGEHELERILTDEESLYQEMKAFLQENQPEDLDKLQLYQDSYPMTALYSIATRLEKALEERVWMKSGAYLVIQPTEALTVIDVNSGKAVKGKKAAEESALKINLEAAREVADQLRLRNISGMILIDFISMKSEEYMEQVMDALRDAVKYDPVKTVVVDMTGLGLVEVTRKRTSRPLIEYKKML